MCPIMINNFFLKIIFKILSKIIIIKKKKKKDVQFKMQKKKKIYDFIINFFKDFYFMKISNSLNGKFTVKRMRMKHMRIS